MIIRFGVFAAGLVSYKSKERQGFLFSTLFIYQISDLF